MKTTTIWYRTPSPGGPEGQEDRDLLARYQAITNDDRLDWKTHHRKVRLLGTGGQGMVFLSERRGADRFTLLVALKIFSPEPYRDAFSYHDDMHRVADMAARVATIQHDNLVDIHNFIEQDGLRIMEMEWIDGYDLRQLLTQRLLDSVKNRVRPEQWDYINNVVITAGPQQPRLKPGIAIQVLRECLVALAALHREGIVHGDLKPSNIMLKRTGNAKVIDIGSAMDPKAGTARRLWSPMYAAPEVLAGAGNSPRSDLASLGYILIEMLAGQCPFEGLTTYDELLAAKRRLDQRLPELLPKEVSSNEMLLNLCQRLAAPDPERRFPSAEAADLDRKGAADFHRQLIKGDLASEYENDIRVWLGSLA
jgi:eukaryotic-like serine/threonine-protein kinase